MHKNKFSMLYNKILHLTLLDSIKVYLKLNHYIKPNELLKFHYLIKCITNYLSLYDQYVI